MIKECESGQPDRKEIHPSTNTKNGTDKSREKKLEFFPPKKLKERGAVKKNRPATIIYTSLEYVTTIER